MWPYFLLCATVLALGGDPFVNVFKHSLPYPVDSECCESIAYGNGAYVMVSRTSQSEWYTTNKLDKTSGKWSSGSFPKAANFSGTRPNNIVYSSGIGFAVCDYFTCWVSPNGILWKDIAPPGTPNLQIPNLAASDDVLVFVDNNNGVWFSKKGSKVWDPSPGVNGGASPGTVQVTYNPFAKLFYLWAPNTINGGNLWQSTNGKHWGNPITKNIPADAIDYGFLPDGRTILVSRLMSNVEANVITVFITNTTGDAHSSNQIAQWTIPLGEAPNGVLAHLALFGGKQAVIGIWAISANYNKWYSAPAGFHGKWKEIPMPSGFIRIGGRQGNEGLLLSFSVLDSQLVVVGPGGYVLKEDESLTANGDFGFQQVTDFVSNEFVLPFTWKKAFYLIPMISYRVLTSSTGSIGSWQDTGKHVLPFGTIPEPDFRCFYQEGLDLFLAVGRFAVYIGGKTPTDSWVVAPLPSGFQQLCQSSEGVGWANGTLVLSCGTDQGAIYTATNIHTQSSTVTWKQTFSQTKYVGGLTNVVVAFGKFIVTESYGDDSKTDTPVHYSTDGITWHTNTKSGIQYGVVGFAGDDDAGVAVAIGYYIPGSYISTDGINYKAIKTPLYTPNSFYWSKPAQVFVALDGNQVMISSDGTSWCYYCLPLYAPDPDQIDSSGVATVSNSSVIAQVGQEVYVTHEESKCYPSHGGNADCDYGNTLKRGL